MANRLSIHRSRTAMHSCYYTPSGKVPASALPIVALYALATLPSAWIHAFLVMHAPVLVKPLLAVAHAGFLGYLGYLAAATAKVRDAAWMARFGWLIGATAWYFQWAAWLALASGGDAALGFLSMMLSPAALSGELASALHAGTWRVGGQPATGLLPALCYLAEAILLVAVPRLSARLRSQEPFCEASNAWADRIAVPRRFAFIDEPRAVRAFLEEHPEQAPTVLSPCAAEAVTRHARVTVHRCRGADSYLSIENISAEVDGQTLKESSAIVVACLRLPGIDPDALLSELEAMASRPAQARGQEKARPLAPQPAGALGHLDAGRLEPAFADAWPPLQATEGVAGLLVDQPAEIQLADGAAGRQAHAQLARAVVDLPLVPADAVETLGVDAGQRAGIGRWQPAA